MKKIYTVKTVKPNYISSRTYFKMKIDGIEYSTSIISSGLTEKDIEEIYEKWKKNYKNFLGKKDE